MHYVYLIAFAGQLGNLLTGGGSSRDVNRYNCKCPCRHYWITKCTLIGVDEKCKPSYDPHHHRRGGRRHRREGHGRRGPRRGRRNRRNYKRKQPRPKKNCTQTPIIKPKRIKVTECQRCQRFYQTVLDITVVR